MTADNLDYAELMSAAASAAGLEPRAIVTPTDHYVRLNGIRLHYLDWGNEHLPHVVLLHGGSLQAHTWDMAALLLRDSYHLIALSQRGHGDTEWTPDEDLDKDNSDLMLEDTRQFIDHLGYDHLTLVGMSMGGLLALALAEEEPVDALAVIGTPLVFRQPFAWLIPLAKHLWPMSPKSRGSDIRDPAARARQQPERARRTDRLRREAQHRPQPAEPRRGGAAASVGS